MNWSNFSERKSTTTSHKYYSLIPTIERIGTIFTNIIYQDREERDKYGVVVNHDSFSMTEGCADCQKKNAEIEYLKAIIALDTLGDGDRCRNAEPNNQNTELVNLKQRLKLIKHHLLLVRADVQYMNREVHSVFEWISKVISVFLSCCGRVSETAAGLVIDSANKIGLNVSSLTKT